MYRIIDVTNLPDEKHYSVFLRKRFPNLEIQSHVDRKRGNVVVYMKDDSLGLDQEVVIDLERLNRSYLSLNYILAHEYENVFINEVGRTSIELPKLLIAEI